MFPFSVIDVKPTNNFELEIIFHDGKNGLIDMKPYLNGGLMNDLKEINIFLTAHKCFDTVAWVNGIDIDPEWLYQNISDNNC